MAENEQAIPQSEAGPLGREQKGHGKFGITYPDGTTDTAVSYEDMMQKAAAWRADHRHA